MKKKKKKKRINFLDTEEWFERWMQLYHLFSTSSSLLRHLAATFRFPFRFTRSLFAPFSTPPLNHATNPAHFRDRQDRRRERTVKWDKQVWRERFETNTLNRELYPAVHPFVIESCSPQKKAYPLFASPFLFLPRRGISPSLKFSTLSWIPSFAIDVEFHLFISN